MFYTIYIGLVIFALSVVRADPTENENVKFLIADKFGIWAIGDTSNKPTLIYEDYKISSFDYHPQKNLLFYTAEYDPESIYSGQLFNKSSAPKLIIRNSQKWAPTSLAVDFINDKLYVLDRRAEKIDIYDLDGKNRAVILGFTFNGPLKLLLDPYSGLMFLNNYDAMKRLNMDGTEHKFLVPRMDRYYRKIVYEFDIDRDNKQIIWGNQSTHAIYSLDYDGKKIKTLLVDEKLDFYLLSFASYGKQMCLLHNNTLESITLDNGKIINRTRIDLPMMENPKVIKSYIKHPLRKINSPCMENNGGCEQICTLKPDNDNGITSSCICKAGYQLMSDLKSCELVTDFMIFPFATHIKSYNLYSSSINSNQAMYPIAPKGDRWYEFGGIGCDTHERQIYFNTKSEQCMYRSRMNDSVKENFFCGNKEQLWDLAFDWVSKNIYFTSYNYFELGKLQVINPRNKTKIKTIIKDVFRPNKLVVHPNKGFIFFVENYFSPNSTIINRINSDGSDLKKFKDLEISKVDHLAIDFKDDKLYWVDTGFHEGVKYMNFDGTNIKRLDSIYTGSPRFLDIYKDHLFLSANHERFYRLDKITGELSKDFNGEFEDVNFYGFRVCDKNAQKLLNTNPCLENNGGCDDFCFSVPNNISDSNSSEELMKVCGCSDDRILKKDGKTCTEKKDDKILKKDGKPSVEKKDDKILEKDDKPSVEKKDDKILEKDGKPSVEKNDDKTSAEKKI